VGRSWSDGGGEEVSWGLENLLLTSVAAFIKGERNIKETIIRYNKIRKRFVNHLNRYISYT
jgi:hypothetical protein